MLTVTAGQNPSFIYCLVFLLQDISMAEAVTHLQVTT